jgi:hypothetical protein
MSRIVLFGSGVGIVTIFGATSIYWNNYAKRFDTMFFHSINKCYDRTKFTLQLRSFLSSANPSGIVFISGRLNAGKTTVIKEALKERKFLAYLNWREKAINSEDSLNERLKESFNIVNFKDYFKNIKTGGLFFNLLMLLIPNINYDDKKMDDLESTLKEIETILKYAGQKGKRLGVAGRPVLYIDELNIIQDYGSVVLKNFKKDEKSDQLIKTFLEWLVRISKDDKLCDVIIASNNGIAWNLLEQLDPQYINCIVVPDFSKDDIQDILKTLHVENMQQKLDFIYEHVGGHAGHVIKMCEGAQQKEATTMESMELALKSIRNGEEDTIQKALDNGQNNKYFGNLFRNLNDGKYLRSEFVLIMETLVQNNIDILDPEIGIDTLIRETKIDKSVIMNLVKLNYLFFNPLSKTIKARNQVFVKSYLEIKDKNKKIDRIKLDILRYQHYIADDSNKDNSVEDIEKWENKILIAKMDLVDLEKRKL